MNYRLILKSRKTNSKTNEAPKEYTCQFWEPGLVSYEDAGAGKALLRKEAMDAMLNSFIGKPVTIDHVEGSPDEIMNAGRAVGTVTNAYWNPDTGWYECKFTVENEDARKKVESGWSVSCAFDVSEQTGPGGEYHAIPFDEEITSGTFTHLALVENPRYEDSKIFKNHKMRLNAKGVKMNKKYAVGDRVEYRGESGRVAGYSGHIVVVDYDAGGTARVSEDNDDLKKRGDMTAFKGSKENAKTVLISIPYRLLERDDDKNPDQELQARGLRNVGGGGGVADFEFNGTESQAAAIVKQVLGTVSGVDIGMMNSKNSVKFAIVDEETDNVIRSYDDKMDAEQGMRQLQAKMPGKYRIESRQNDTSDFGTILREIKEQLYQMAQALAGKFNGRAGVFKKGDSVRDVYGDWCTIVGEAQSGDYYVVKYADGSTARMREGDLNNSKEKENSYGNYSIHSDMKGGLSDADIVKKIRMRYTDIDEAQAQEIVKAVKQGGPNASADWSHRSKDAYKYNASGWTFKKHPNADGKEVWDVIRPDGGVYSVEASEADAKKAIERESKENGKKEQVYQELTELGKLGKLGKDYHKYFRRLERTDVETEFQGMSVSDITDQIVMLENSKSNAWTEIQYEKDANGDEFFIDSTGRKVYKKNLRNPERVAMEKMKRTKENAGEPYSVSIEHKPEERGGDVYRVVLIKDGKEADHILVKGDAAAQEQKKKWLKQYNSKQNSSGDQFQVGDKVKRSVGALPGDPSGKIVEKRELTCKVKWDGATSLQEVQYYTDLQKTGAKNSRVILKPGKSNSTQEKKPMFGLFKRKSKKNDQEAAPEKLPLEQIDVEIDGVAVPLSELVTGFKAEQAEVAEKQKLEQAQAAKEVTESPAPEANADNTAPEDLNLENQEFSIEDGSRFNMTELVDSYNRRKAAKCNAEKEKEKDDYLNALDFGDGKSEAEARAKLKEMGWSDAEIEETIKTKKEGQAAADAAKKNASETPEEKAAKENAKKDPKYFHKLNDLKNAGEVLTGKAMETLSDKIERGNARYGSKKK